MHCAVAYVPLELVLHASESCCGATASRAGGRGQEERALTCAASSATAAHRPCFCRKSWIWFHKRDILLAGMISYFGCLGDSVLQVKVVNTLSIMLEYSLSDSGWQPCTHLCTMKLNPSFTVVTSNASIKHLWSKTHIAASHQGSFHSQQNLHIPCPPPPPPPLLLPRHCQTHSGHYK